MLKTLKRNSKTNTIQSQAKMFGYIFRIIAMIAPRNLDWEFYRTMKNLEEGFNSQLSYIYVE